MERLHFICNKLRQMLRQNVRDAYAPFTSLVENWFIYKVDLL